MKRILTIIGIVIGVLLVAFLGLRSVTKSKSPEAKATFSQNGLSVTVDYCQPSMKGRKIFGALLPYGKVWRTGANEATLIDISQDVMVSGQPLKAGKYSFWTIPATTGWTAIFNKQTGQWGTMYDEKQDVLRVSMQVRSVGNPVEQFNIGMTPQPTGADMVLRWENTEATLPIRKP